MCPCRRESICKYTLAYVRVFEHVCILCVYLCVSVCGGGGVHSYAFYVYVSICVCTCPLHYLIIVVALFT